MDSWRRVGSSLRPNVVIDTVNCGLPIPSVSGALHWLAHIQGEENQVILSFHVNNESFKELATPIVP